MRSAIVAVGVAVLCGGTAWAEEGSAYPTAVSVVGGLSVGTSQTVGRQLFGLGNAGSGSGFAAGASLAHDLSPRLTFEATGLYFDRSSSAWSADMGLRINLRPTSESIVPYAAVSGGVYSERVQTQFGALKDKVQDLEPVLDSIAALIPQVAQPLRSRGDDRQLPAVRHAPDAHQRPDDLRRRRHLRVRRAHLRASGRPRPGPVRRRDARAGPVHGERRLSVLTARTEQGCAAAPLHTRRSARHRTRRIQPSEDHQPLQLAGDLVDGQSKVAIPSSTSVTAAELISPRTRARPSPTP